MQGFVINAASKFFTTEEMNARGMSTIFQRADDVSCLVDRVEPSKPLIDYKRPPRLAERLLVDHDGAGDTNYALAP